MLYFQNSFGQSLNYYCTIGGGVSTLENGWIAHNAYSFEKKRNQFTISLSYSSETGHRLAGFIFPEFYNDHFSEVSVLYGRVYRPAKWFHLSASAGPSVYYYTDKEIGGRSGGYISWQTTTSRHYTGIGLALKGEILFITGEDLAFGFNLLGNINADRINGAILFSIAFGMFQNE